ncbi:hypothetical protein HII31_08092 [Pseudocercospora fuligena]|uniref:Glycosyltransferase family 31 protein n=1 Tax=Pseudocercospora fuligena TaxID=685502 RepID=A0A8H6VFZ7_9PEZI|nr:hypothetical protein HII31_08092 [Pseudocercospora fuligena]
MSAVLSGARGVTLSRIAVIFLLVLAVFLFRDTWLPRGDSYKAGQSFTPLSDNEKSRQRDQATELTPDHGKLLTDPTPPPPLPSDETDDVEESSHHVNETCLHLPGANKVMIMLKTGATELYQKLPTHFVTTLKCIPHFIIFSDLEQSFADTKIHDAIKPVSKKVREKHEDFKMYREIEKWHAEGQDLGKLMGDSGWNLDKWKFLPMFHETFENAPDHIEWFVMIEADTSLHWLNLLLWLQSMDHQQPYYLGAQNVIGDTTFAHGGSGIVVSRKAADILEAARYNAGKELYDEKWEDQTAISCCGDEIIARAFKAVDIPLTPAWPLIQGETISTVDFTEHHWCTPPMTFHHVSPIEVDTYWQFQIDWAAEHGWRTPYLYRDIFEHFLGRHVTVNRTSWNNLSNDQRFVSASLTGEDDTAFSELEPHQQKATESEELCAEACVIEGEKCIQWMFTPGRCHLGRDIRFGKSDEREEEHWRSGWIQERIDQFRKSQEGCKINWRG